MVEISRLTGRFLFTVDNHLDAQSVGRLFGISGESLRNETSEDVQSNAHRILQVAPHYRD